MLIVQMGFNLLNSNVLSLHFNFKSGYFMSNSILKVHKLEFFYIKK